MATSDNYKSDNHLLLLLTVVVVQSVALVLEMITVNHLPCTTHYRMIKCVLHRLHLHMKLE